MRYRGNRPCDDCGKRKPLEQMNEVEWTYTFLGRQQVTWLALCTPCAKIMSACFTGDPTTQLIFHPY